MVLGDHGMADTGGHGGTSLPEVIVPLISFGLGCSGVHRFVYRNIIVSYILCCMNASTISFI